MKIVVGLGNPGRRYAQTPHNAGFNVIAVLAIRLGCRLRKDARANAKTGKARLGDDWVLLVQPQTYMNESGEAVGALMRYHKASLEDVLVVVDDADLPLGRLRVRAEGSSGGHRGLESIIEHVGGGSFPRVRIGIGRQADGRSLVDHVLAKPGVEEREILTKEIERASEAVVVSLQEGVETAMNRYNRRQESNDGLTDTGRPE